MPPSDGVPQGRLYAAVEHLLDPGYPTIGFVMRSPFPLPMPETAISLIAGLSGNDPEQVLFTSEHVNRSSQPNRWAFDYAKGWVSGELGDRLEALYTEWEATPTFEWILTFTTGNVLDPNPDRGHTETVWRLLERCLSAFNDWGSVYRVATEAAAVRPLRPENLDEHVLVLVRSDEQAAPVFAGVLTTPTLTTPAFQSDVPADEWFRRITNLVSMHGHPVNDVILWKLRADYLSDYVGDYALAIISLQTAAERLVAAIWRTIRVDRGWTAMATEGSRHFGATTPGFKNMLMNISVDLRDPWDDERVGGSVATYWRDLYMVRNRVVHSGIEPDAKMLDAGFMALQALRDWVGERTITTRHEFPRTSILVHSWVGLEKDGALDGEMLAFMKQIAEHGESFNFWLPIDERDPG